MRISIPPAHAQFSRKLSRHFSISPRSCAAFGAIRIKRNLTLHRPAPGFPRPASRSARTDRSRSPENTARSGTAHPSDRAGKTALPSVILPSSSTGSHSSFASFAIPACLRSPVRQNDLKLAQNVSPLPSLPVLPPLRRTPRRGLPETRTPDRFSASMSVMQFKCTHAFWHKQNAAIRAAP